MMYDPREAKLPKWAQEMFSEVRIRSDLSWPNEPRPEPVVVADGASGHVEIGREFKGEAWKVYGGAGFSGRSVKRVVIDDIRTERDPAFPRSGGSRMGGRYYATERDAWLAAWWDECVDSARRIHAIAQRVRVISD